MEEQRRLARRVLDRPAVGAGAVRQAAAVQIPAAAPPAGREHLPMDEVLHSAVLRHAPSRHARLHLRQRRDGVAAVLERRPLHPSRSSPVWSLLSTHGVCEEMQVQNRGNHL